MSRQSRILNYAKRLRSHNKLGRREDPGVADIFHSQDLQTQLRSMREENRKLKEQLTILQEELMGTKNKYNKLIIRYKQMMRQQQRQQQQYQQVSKALLRCENVYNSADRRAEQKRIARQQRAMMMQNPQPRSMGPPRKRRRRPFTMEDKQKLLEYYLMVQKNFEEIRDSTGYENNQQRLNAYTTIRTRLNDAFKRVPYEGTGSDLRSRYLILLRKLDEKIDDLEKRIDGTRATV